MADQEERSATSDRADEEGVPAREVPEVSAGSPVPEPPQKTGTSTSRPRQIAGKYPQRQMTYYQISSSEIRSIGVAQAFATIFAAMGTFALSSYLDFKKDIALALHAGQEVPPFLDSVTDLVFWAWIVFWAVAIGAFGYQGVELRRIKAEHGELAPWTRAWNRWKQ